MRRALIAIALVACSNSSALEGPGGGAGSGSGSSTLPPLHGGPKPTKKGIEQLPLPDALRAPPADALTSPDGIKYKMIVANDAGTPAKKNDILLVNYTGWKLPSGETFFTTHSRGQPMPVSLSQETPGFTAALLLLKKGEKADVWVSPEVLYRGRTMPKDPETLVYEVEVIDITPAPPAPADVAAPPANAKMLAVANVPYEIVKDGPVLSKPEPVRPWDTISFGATSWDATGRMLDTTELRKRAATSIVFREPHVVQQVLSQMVPGERIRFWVDAEQLVVDKQSPAATKGLACFELELIGVTRPKHDPPATPADVAKQPADAKMTKLGVFYKVLASAGGTAHPTSKDTVTVRFTGWRTDGTMFDSTTIRAVKDDPVDLPASSGVPGWIDTLAQMSAGDHWRIWIPAELAYKGAPGKPQGMLVFDLELVGVKTAK